MFAKNRSQNDGRLALFRRSKKLESRIDEFFDNVVESGLLFKRGVNIYLKGGATVELQECLDDAEELENRNDELRRRIETELYLNTLIPDARGDVLRLLENMDDLVNLVEANLFRLSIQQPEVCEEFKSGFKDLANTVILSVEEVVQSGRAFFRNFNTVRDHNAKVIFFESEADKISTRLQRQIFAADLPLERKRHLVYFVEKFDDLANGAEDIADEVGIYAIKRRI